MVQFSKEAAAGGTWRLRDERTGEYVGRLWATPPIDRLLRDADLAEAVAAALALPRAERRQAAITAYTAWVAAGGQAVDLTALTHTARDGNVHLSLSPGGTALGYIHGTVYNVARPLRYVQLAEALHAARTGPAGTRQAATDAALDRFATAGGVG